MPGRFKDYISTPKQNDYRSIHTTVVGPGSQRVELQIRTEAMHRIAEYGIAAHALYKDGVARRTARATAATARAATAARLAGFNDEIRAYEWLRRTIEMLAEGDTPEEFLEHTKLELFQDQVFCFTPEGPADRAAARRDADRLRLCRPHRHRRHLRRRQDQRPRSCR